MMRSETTAPRQSVTAFLKTVEPGQRRADCRAIARMMREATGNRARMAGSGIVGFGRYHYSFANGKSGSSILCGFSPRKREIVIYIMPGFQPFGALMKRIGKHKTGKSCLYIKSLADVDLEVLEALIDRSVRLMKNKYGVA